MNQTIQKAAFLVITCFFFFSCGKKQTTEKVENPVIESSPDYETIFANAQNDLQINVPSTRSKKEPLVMVHYMPWFQAPPTSSEYGFHWHQGGARFDPYEVLENGCSNIASHYYPLTGPYDTANKNLLEYQVALMKISGIDGVIFDWYGIEDALDYKEIQTSTVEMIKILKKAGLKYIICYEDQSIGKMIEAGLITKENALNCAKETFSWMNKNFFGDEAYVKYNEQPVLLNFGPQYFFDKSDWDSLFAECSSRPYSISLEGHSDGFVDGQYNWFNMNGQKTIPQVVNQLNNFYERQKDKPFLVATAYPGFHDIYAQAGAKSYGYLDYCDGKTFTFTLDASLKANPDIVQIATWNDYGEGTVIEPTIQHGYTELEVLQNLQKTYSSDFQYNRKDLRSPLALYKILTEVNQDETTTSKQKAAELAMDAILTDDFVAYKSILKEEGIKVDFSVDPILLKPSSEEKDSNNNVFNPNGRENLAFGKPVVANNKIYDFEGRNINDSDVNTYWEGAADSYPNTIQIDLINPTEIDVSVLKLNPQKIWGKRTQTIEVLTSMDGIDFTILKQKADYEFNPIENSNTVVIQLGCKARYVRFDITDNTGGSAGQIAELEIYGK